LAIAGRHNQADSRAEDRGAGLGLLFAKWLPPCGL
jgi:hypothetical protein